MSRGLAKVIFPFALCVFSVSSFTHTALAGKIVAPDAVDDANHKSVDKGVNGDGAVRNAEQQAKNIYSIDLTGFPGQFQATPQPKFLNVRQHGFSFLVEGKASLNRYGLSWTAIPTRESRPVSRLDQVASSPTRTASSPTRAPSDEESAPASDLVIALAQQGRKAISKNEYYLIEPDDDLSEDTKPVIQRAKYPCPIKGCTRRFQKTNDRAAHMRTIHGGENLLPKPDRGKGQFLCPMDGCGKRFENKVSLTNHIRTKHEGKTYPCPVCGFEFSQPTSRNRHLWKKHDGGGDFDFTPVTESSGTQRGKKTATSNANSDNFSEENNTRTLRSVRTPVRASTSGQASSELSGRDHPRNAPQNPAEQQNTAILQRDTTEFETSDVVPEPVSEADIAKLLAGWSLIS